MAQTSELKSKAHHWNQNYSRRAVPGDAEDGELEDRVLGPVDGSIVETKEVRPTAPISRMFASRRQGEGRVQGVMTSYQNY